MKIEDETSTGGEKPNDVPEAGSTIALQPPAQSSQRLHLILLGLILVLAACLEFYQLGQSGYQNLYYAAGIKSLLSSWHNFFFMSFDPGGFVTVDKPPLGFWMQALSATLFGFSPFSILFPEALATVLSVLVLYRLVLRAFGSTAGLLAALVLALTPISVVTGRNNTIDSLLVLATLLAAWAISTATERGALRYLLLGAAIVGLGFNIKMLEAYLVVPAFALMYLLGAPLRWRTKIWHLLLAGCVLLIISLSWAVAVDLTPATQRPYVGSSPDNSEITLAFGYNGLQRLTGLFRGGGGATSVTQVVQELFQPNNAVGGFFAGETGQPGLLRFFNQALGGQISWLLPLALLSLVVIGWQKRIRLPLNLQQQALVLWGVWLLTMLAFFSVAGFFHVYYLVMLAPAIAALCGAGMVLMWQDYRRPGWRGWLLPLALVGVAVVQTQLLGAYPAWANWLAPTIIILCLAAALLLLIARLNVRLRERPFLLPIALGGFVALLIAPTLWGAVPVLQGRGSSLPSAGPSIAQGNPFGGGGFPGGGGAGRRGDFDFPRGDFPGGGAGGFPGGFGGGGGAGGQGGIQVNQGLITYLEANRGNAQFLLAVPNANAAAPIILATGEPVMALGGFLGSDPILTQSQLIALVNNGTVRFFQLAGGGGGRGGFGGGGGSATQWVTTHCAVVAPADYAGSSTTTGGGAGSLYDCANHS